MSGSEEPPEKAGRLPHYPAVDSDDSAQASPNGGSIRKAPRWVFALVIIGILVILFLHLTGILGPGLH